MCFPEHRPNQKKAIAVLLFYFILLFYPLLYDVTY